MTLFWQSTLNGLSLAASYALIAYGLTLVYGIGRIVNLAHGDILMVGAYGTLVGVEWGLPYLVAALFGVVLAAVMGFGLERGLISRRLYNAPEYVSLVIMFAVGIILTNVAQLSFGTVPREVRSPFTAPTVGIGNVRLDEQQLLTLVAGIVVTVALIAWLTYSRTGRALLAIVQNPRGALYSGLNVPKLRTIGFVLGAALAGLAGVLIAPTQTAYPSLGDGSLVIAFTVVIFGGLGSVKGTALGALVVGLLYEYVGTYVSTNWTTAVEWLLVIVVLLLRPQGLLGQKPTRV